MSGAHLPDVATTIAESAAKPRTPRSALNEHLAGVNLKRAYGLLIGSIVEKAGLQYRFRVKPLEAKGHVDAERQQQEAVDRKTDRRLRTMLWTLAERTDAP